jgi:hypothetical protein
MYTRRYRLCFQSIHGNHGNSYNLRTKNGTISHCRRDSSKSLPFERVIYLHSLGILLIYFVIGISDIGSWYKVKKSDIVEQGGEKLLAIYKGSFPKAIMKAFPELPWQPWLFPYVSRGFWEDKTNLESYIKWLSQELCIQNMEEWYDVNKRLLSAFQAKTLQEKPGGML